MGKIGEWPDNQAPWNYLLGFFEIYQPKEMPSTPRKETKQMKDYPQLKGLFDLILSLDPRNHQANSLKVNYLLSFNDQKMAQDAISVMELLRDEYNKVRKNYWAWMIKVVTKDILKA